MGFVSEDGTVTGSIDANQLDDIDPKTDEAKAQIEALKAERDAGQKQAADDAEKLAEQSKAQSVEGQVEKSKEDEKADEKAAKDAAKDEKKSAPSHSHTDKG